MTPTVVDIPAPREPAVRLLGVPPALPRPEVRTSGPRHARPSARSTWFDHVLTMAALLGIVTVGVTLAAVLLGLRPLVVRSGSMEPTIHTGSMVLVRMVPARQVHVGDVVAVKRPDRTTVTHRVLKVEPRGSSTVLTLKGDANQDPDPDPVVASEAGKLVLTTPWLGRLGALLASARGGFALGWVVAVVMLSVLRRRTD